VGTEKSINFEIQKRLLERSLDFERDMETEEW